MEIKVFQTLQYSTTTQSITLYCYISEMCVCKIVAQRFRTFSVIDNDLFYFILFRLILAYLMNNRINQMPFCINKLFLNYFLVFNFAPFFLHCYISEMCICRIVAQWFRTFLVRGDDLIYLILSRLIIYYHMNIRVNQMPFCIIIYML